MTGQARPEGSTQFETAGGVFFFFLAFAVYTIKAALEMNDVVFSSSCLVCLQDGEGVREEHNLFAVVI